MHQQVPGKVTAGSDLAAMMDALLRHYGAQNWWPARSRFEVIVGAILVQNTAWRNAEVALRKLRTARVLHPAGIRRTPILRLEELVRSSGYYRQKAQRLKAFVRFLDDGYGGSLQRMFAQKTATLREQLLGVHGIGEETADAILLYAGGHEAFVVDAYARRVAERHGFKWAKYAAVQAAYVEALQGMEASCLSSPSPRYPPSRMSRRGSSARAKLFQEAHAVLVRVGSEFCKRSPECGKCPLRQWLTNEPLG